MKEKNEKIGFIGAGKMGQAIMKGIIESGFLPKSSICFYDTNDETIEKVQKELGVKACQNIEDIMKTSGTILISTKPFVANEVLDNIKDKIRNHLVISIMAGVSTKKIEEKLPNTRVVRVMPNTPAIVNEGMSAICKGKYAYDYDCRWVLELFSNLGSAILIDEKDIDIVTAISGSGPAFFYYFIDKIALAGKKLGLDDDVALKLSAQTALGSAKMILNTSDTPETLIKNVTTPGGCTEVGNNILINSKVEDILFKTIKRTMDKAKKLG